MELDRPEPRNASHCLVETQGLRKVFGGQVVLRDVDVSLSAGEIVLLRGANGSGKTTLINILTGYLTADAGVISVRRNGTFHRFRFPWPWWAPLNPRNAFLPQAIARCGLSRTWQDTRLFPSLNVLENVVVGAKGNPGESMVRSMVPWRGLRRHEEQLRHEAQSALDRLGLAGREASSGDRLSLGQTKRVAIMRAVKAGARALFLDEPLAGLDRTGILAVLGLLRELVAGNRLSLVIVEHELNAPAVLEIASTVWNLAGGQIRVEPVVRANDGDRSVDPGDDGHWRGTGAVGLLGKSFVKTREFILGSGGWLEVYRRRGASDTSTSVLQIRAIAVSRGRRMVIGRIGENGEVSGELSFDLCPGDVALLFAPNGYGKTTLMDAIAGLLPIQSGQVLMEGCDIASVPPWSRSRLGVGYLRSSDFTFPSLTVREYLAIGAVGPSLSQDEVSFLGRRMGALSGGERKAVALRRLLSRGAKVVLMDEPFGGLDGKESQRLVEALESAEGSAFLIALPTRTFNRYGGKSRNERGGVS